MGEKKNIIELTLHTREEYAGLRKLPLSVLCDSVRSMHNVGSVLRTADALLIDEVILCGISGCPPHPEIAKTALGAERSVAWRYASDACAEVARLKAGGMRVCVLEQAHGSVPLHEFSPAAADRCLLVVGNEVAGVDQRIVDMADVVLEIPQYGTKHSLNVSVSAGIAMHHIAVRMMQQTM